MVMSVSGDIKEKKTNKQRKLNSSSAKVSLSRTLADGRYLFQRHRHKGKGSDSVAHRSLEQQESVMIFK